MKDIVIRSIKTFIITFIVAMSIFGTLIAVIWLGIYAYQSNIIAFLAYGSFLIALIWTAYYVAERVTEKKNKGKERSRKVYEEATRYKMIENVRNEVERRGFDSISEILDEENAKINARLWRENHAESE